MEYNVKNTNVNEWLELLPTFGELKTKLLNMKKTILTFLLFCFVVFSVGAQTVNTNTTTSHQKNAVEKSKTVKENINTNGAVQSIAQDENPNAPDIQFEKMEYDYGTITQESDGLCTFKFVNAGREPLMLYNVKSS